MTLCCCYRHGDENIDDFISYIDYNLSDIDTEYCDFVLTGDINVHYSGKKSIARKLNEFASKHNLSQIVSKPTRVTENSNTMIDLIFTNSSHKIVQCDVLQSSIYSDHSIVFCTFKEASRIFHRKYWNIVVTNTMTRRRSCMTLAKNRGV